MPLRIQERAERRQVTILHCDIVNSTEVVDSLDPEDVLTLMEAYLDRWIEIVEQYHGTFVGYTGDGFQAYFGYPIAREEAAIDALRAALAVSEMLCADAAPVAHELECRIGVATGRVVVAESGAEAISRSLVAFGTAPCMAARLEQAANPGCILIDSTTFKLVENAFVLREFGAIPAKGIGHEVHAWEVTRTRRPSPRFDATRLSPYVGRDQQLGQLTECWQSVVSGEGRAVLLIGEAGIGKSRLAYEFEQTVSQHTGHIFRFQCSNLNTSTPLHPWCHWLEQVANIAQQDQSVASVSKLDNCLTDKFGFTKDLAQFSAAVMGLSTEPSFEEEASSTQKLLTRLQYALAENLLNSASVDPVIVLIEDMHWMDASTSGMIERLLNQINNRKLLLLMTSRPEGVPDFGDACVVKLKLPQLDEPAVGKIVDAFLSEAGEGFDTDTLKTIVQKCEGNPLFVEEFAKHYLGPDGPARGNSDIDDVPILLQGSLLARIDAAGKGKKTAQLAAVIGREFDPALLFRLSDESPAVVQEHLNQLHELNILSRTAINNRTFYTFRHALLREAIYASLLRGARATVHSDLASILAAERQSCSAEVIARHYEACGNYVLAFQYWLEAGQHALQSGATKEAVTLLGEAESLVDKLDDRLETIGDIAEMYMASGLAVTAAHGVVAEPLRYYRLAERYASQAGDSGLLLTSLDWQFGVLFNAGELAPCVELARKLKRLGTSMKDTAAVASGYQAMGMAHFMRGEFDMARREFEEGLETAAAYISGEHCFPSMTLSYLAWTYFVLGDEDKAASCAERSIASARRESPHAIATALSNCSYVFQSIRSIDTVYALTDELIEFAAKQGEHIILERASMTRSWADCMSGCGDRPADAFRAHVDQLLCSGEEVELTYHLGVLADLQIRNDDYAAAAGTLARAIGFANKNGEHFYLAELYRLTHLVLEKQPALRAPDDRKDYFATAMQLARRQNAEAWIKRLTDQVTPADQRTNLAPGSRLKTRQAAEARDDPR